MHARNHFLPRMYLKNFAGANDKIYAYRVLVPRPEMRLWKPYQSAGIGYHLHLYTRILAGSETDEIENWLNAEIEFPAADPLQKAICDGRLTPDDWFRLVAFLVCQYVRTPAFFIQNLPRWHSQAPRIMREVVDEAARTLQEGGSFTVSSGSPSKKLIRPPFKTTAQVTGDGKVQLKSNVLVGRAFWLYAVQHLLSSQVGPLAAERWTILCPHNGLSWITSDNPVVRLGSDGKERNLDGGLGVEGNEIFIPLSPRQLLYSRIGFRPPTRGTVLSLRDTQEIRRLLAQNAYRMVFASEVDPEVEKFRPRVVSQARFDEDRKLWEEWPESQARAEREFATNHEGAPAAKGLPAASKGSANL